VGVGQLNIGNERDVFYVRLGGFDTHTDLTEQLALLLKQADAVKLPCKSALKMHTLEQ